MNTQDPIFQRPKPPGPGFHDWALLAISLTFVVLGLFIARRSPRDALMPITFFGVCALTFGFIIARKLRRRRFAATTVAVAGGVKLRGSNSRMLGLAAMIGAPGIVIFAVPGSPLLIRICAAIMLGASAMLLVGVLTGLVSRRFLRFDPPGLTIGEARFEYFIPWDEIADIIEFEMHDNAVVGFDVLHPEAILVTPESARTRLLKGLARNQAFVNRHVAIMPLHFAVPAESLCAALRNYAENRDARTGLVARPALRNGLLAIYCAMSLAFALFFPPPALAANDVRETIGPMTITVPSTWARNVNAAGTINYVPDPASQYSFSKVDNGTPNQLDGHRLMWGEIKKNAGTPKTERSGKAGRFEWSETIATDRTAPREIAVRFYSTKEGGTHICAVIVAMSPALLQTRAAELEKILGAAQFAGASPNPASRAAASAPAGDIPIVGSHIKVEVRFGGVGGSSSTTDHILLFGNGVAVRTGVINGAIECYAIMPVTNLSELPFNYGRWRDNKAANSIDVQWKEGSSWQMKREGGLLSVDGRKLLNLRPLEAARFNGIYAYRPVGDAPTALALTPDGRFEAQNLIDNMICNSGPPAPKNGRGTYEVRKWTLILRFDNGSTAMLPLHIRNEENLTAVTRFWVKSYEFEPVR